jgi:hypothetical protein
MNKTISDFTRKTILEGLRKLPDSHLRMFKLMYGRKNGKRSVEEAEQMPIDDVAAEISEDKLSWALTQIENSLMKLESK